ncbi:Nitrogen regulatory protein areA, GATA-like domain [Fusarium oxysporum f. sp. vasinfectum]|nr:Nitrogen regulatory protein areA, GATA-like domain [Fusarium oxysporum f. sp. vasinfectum]
MFSCFAQERFYIRPAIDPNEDRKTSSSSRSGDSCLVYPADDANAEVSDHTLRPSTPDNNGHTKDDIAISSRPSRHVDYLSHNWREEDIWSSWRYIVMRRGNLPDSVRLENAAWRTWIQAKNNLKTISPETLDWLKDCDITWLYGPMHSALDALDSTQTEPSKVPLSKTNSDVNLDKKSILKRRSLSEVMLQRSLSTASLLKQATAAVKTQEARGSFRPHVGRSPADCLSQPFSQRQLGGENSSVSSSTKSSGITSPTCERKHTHFNERVEQCIAVEVKGVEHSNKELDTGRYGNDSDLEDGVMLKRANIRRRSLFQRRALETEPAEGKTITMLPSTTLKYRKDTPEPRRTASKHSRSPVIPSSSLQDLRPAKQPRMLFVGEGEDDSLDNVMLNFSIGWPSPPAQGANDGLCRPLSSDRPCEEPAGMRRTLSGMSMPYEERGASLEDGILDRVIDTVNTARDIAYVIWSVGWRK